MSGKIGNYRPFNSNDPKRINRSKTRPNVLKRMAQYVESVKESNKQINEVIQSATTGKEVNPKGKKALKKLLRANVEKSSTTKKVGQANRALKDSQLKARVITKGEGTQRVHVTGTGDNKKNLGSGTFKEASQTVEISGRSNLSAKGRLHKSQVHYTPKISEIGENPSFAADVVSSVRWSKFIHRSSIPGASWREDPSKLFLKYKEIKEGEIVTLSAEPLEQVTSEMLYQMPNKQKKAFILQLLSASAFLKQKTLLHRDLKPENLLLKQASPDEKQLIISDFGTMETFRDHKYNATLKGTFTYMPPRPKDEAIGDYANRQDDFAIGLILLEIAFKYNIEDLHESAIKRQIPFSREKIQNLVLELHQKSNPICEIIAGLITQPPEERIDIDEAKALCEQIQDEHFNAFST